MMEDRRAGIETDNAHSSRRTRRALKNGDARIYVFNGYPEVEVPSMLPTPRGPGSLPRQRNVAPLLDASCGVFLVTSGQAEEYGGLWSCASLL